MVRRTRSTGRSLKSSESAIASRLSQALNFTSMSRDEKRQHVRDRIASDLIGHPWQIIEQGAMKGRYGNLRNRVRSKPQAVLDAFVNELRPDRSGYTNLVVKAMRSAIDEGTDPLSVFDRIFVEGYGTNFDDPDALAITSLAWSAARESPEIRSALAHLYRSLDDRIAPVMGEMMTAWGRQPVAPFTWSSISMIVTTVVEGLIVRARFDQTISDILLGDVVLALYHGLTMDFGLPNEHVRDRFQAAQIDLTESEQLDVT